ncbi:MAG: M3 family metallopeptidase, partial [Burkholderiales bacterium]
MRFAPAELKGLPENYLTAHKKEKDGSLLLSFDYPDYMPFVTFAEDAAARERYYKAFQSRGTPRNLEILDEIVKLRAELTELHDMDSFAELVTARNMVEEPDTVLDFLQEVREVVDEVEGRDMLMLREMKARHLGGDPRTIQFSPWDKEFYLERLRRTRHNVDQEALRKYFPANETREWVLKISSDLYGLKFTPRKAPFWHKDVLLYDVSDAASKTFIGSIYLDLYPRPGKYGHAAAFPMRGSSGLLKRTPITVLVTNFDRKGLNPQEVETFLHEFGHALHGILSHTRYVAQAGTSVARDFVEAPSQMYEEWARRPETLRLMKGVCASCPLVDDDLAARLDASRRLGSGLLYGRQHLYASFDMELAGEDPKPAMEAWKELEGKTPFGYVESTQFPGTFAHIAGGYAAGYYGYM